MMAPEQGPAPSDVAKTGGVLRDLKGQFLPGVSGHPGGRSRVRYVSEALKSKLGEPKGEATRAEILAEKALELAEQGSVRSLKVILERSEGKVPQTVNLGRASIKEQRQQNFITISRALLDKMTHEEFQEMAAQMTGRSTGPVKVYVHGPEGSFVDNWQATFPEWEAKHNPPAPQPRPGDELFEAEDPPASTVESSVPAGMQQNPTTEAPLSEPARQVAAQAHADDRDEPEEPPFLRARVPPGMHLEETEVDGMKVKRYVINPPAEKKPSSLWDL